MATSEGVKQCYLSIKELATRWAIPEKTIYNWIMMGGEGLPPIYKFGRGARKHIRFRVSDVEKIETNSKQVH